LKELSIGKTINKNIPKEAFFRNITVAPAVRNKFYSDIQRIILTYSISPLTSSIAAGQEIKEIDIMLIELKSDSISDKVLETIARQTPVTLLFDIIYNDIEQFAVFHKKLYATKWFAKDYYVPKIMGIDLDEVWKTLVSQICGVEVGAEKSLDAAIDDNEKQEKIMMQIRLLERKLKNEKQFNRQVDMSNEIKRLKGQLREYE